MTLESFGNGLAIFCGTALVLVETWAWVGKGRQRKRASRLWGAFCLEKGWHFTPYTVSCWLGSTSPSVRGSWRGRQFIMENSAVKVVGGKAGTNSFDFMRKSSFKEPRKQCDFPYVNSAYAGGPYAVISTSQVLAECILGQEQLPRRMQQLLDQGCGLVGLDDEGVCAAGLDWFNADPATTPQVLDLLCDLADAAEQVLAR